MNALGVFIVEELIHCHGHPKIPDCICVLLASVTVSGITVLSIYHCERMREVANLATLATLRDKFAETVAKSRIEFYFLQGC